MVKIRLARYGKRNDPFYRIVVCDHRKKLGGRNFAVLGFWYPMKNDIKIDKKEVETWVAKGAQVSKAVSNLMK